MSLRGTPSISTSGDTSFTYTSICLPTDCRFEADRRKLRFIGTSMPIRLGSGDKLLILRRLDRDRNWESLDDKRYCRCCGATFIGRQVDVVGGTRGSGRLRLLCPTQGCASTSKDWVYPARDDAAHSSQRHRHAPQDVHVAGIARLLRALRARA